MPDWKTRLAACCLAWAFASPATAADPAPLVVLDRADFVTVLEQVDFLRQDQANLTEQIAALTGQLDAVKGQAEAQQQAIAALEAQVEDEKSKADLLTADRARMAKELERTDFWGTVKNYGLVFLGALAVAALAL